MHDSDGDFLLLSKSSLGCSVLTAVHSREWCLHQIPRSEKLAGLSIASHFPELRFKVAIPSKICHFSVNINALWFSEEGRKNGRYLFKLDLIAIGLMNH
jgi:hypothetical protein